MGEKYLCRPGQCRGCDTQGAVDAQYLRIAIGGAVSLGLAIVAWFDVRAAVGALACVAIIGAVAYVRR